MEERLRFVARLLDGEKMAGLCREFGISNKTTYRNRLKAAITETTKKGAKIRSLDEKTTLEERRAAITWAQCDRSGQ